MRIELGDQVKGGDLIAEIDSTTQENNLRNARAGLASVRAQRAIELATLRQSQLAFERQRMTLAEDATSRADYESAEATADSTRAQIQVLDAQIEQRQTELDTAQGQSRLYKDPANGANSSL